jgi:hypothetical protein
MQMLMIEKSLRHTNGKGMQNGKTLTIITTLPGIEFKQLIKWIFSSNNITD